MDGFLAFLACIVLMLVLVGPILAIIALAKLSRLRHVEERLQELSSKLAALERDEPRNFEAKAKEEDAPAALDPFDQFRAEREATREKPSEAESLATAARERASALSAKPEVAEPPATAKEGAEPATPWAERFKDIEWERWIGVRGMAVIGGVVGSLAAIFLFKHAIDSGWIGPGLRVTIGVLVGVACLLGGGRLRKRAFAFVPDALQGIGIVALYAATWAADERYELIGLLVSFPLMALVTLLACMVAMRHGSLLAALLGLVGGFATPLLLSSGEDRPFSLFGYVLLLDMGLFLLGKKRGWPSLGLLAVLGTALIEGLWIFGRMGEERMWLGLAILAVFAALFAASAGWLPAAERKRWLPAQAAAILFPFVFAFTFGAGNLEGPLYHIGLLLGLLVGAGLYVAREQKRPEVAAAAVVGSLSVVLVWLSQTQHAVTTSAWEFSLVVLGLAAIPYGFAEYTFRRTGKHLTGRGAQAGVIAGIGWALTMVFAGLSPFETSLWPLLVGIVGASAMLFRQGQLANRPPLVLGAPIASGLALVTYRVEHVTLDAPQTPDAPWLMLVWILLALEYLRYGLFHRDDAFGKYSLHGVGLVLLPSLLDLVAADYYRDHDPWLLPVATLVCGVLLAGAAVALRGTTWLGIGVAIAFLLQTGWTGELVRNDPSRGAAGFALAVIVATASLFTAWPLLWRKHIGERASAWAAAALAAVVFWMPVQDLYEAVFGDRVPALAPLALAAVSLGVLAATRRALDPTSAVRGEAFAWLGGSAALLCSLAVALQGDHEELLVTGALWSAGLAFVGWRARHQGPGWVALCVALVSAFGITVRALQGSVYASSDALVWNALSYVHLLAALAFLGAAYVLGRDDSAGEPLAPYRWLWKLRTVLPGLCAVLAIFLWFNLLILNHFETGPRIAVELERLQARDLSISIGWGVYALLLLALGTLRRAGGLRWTSLALFFLSIGKVFLFDLGQLEGLYRVGSLAGLAMSLIVVSLLYQRFVFRKEEASVGSAP